MSEIHFIKSSIFDLLFLDNSFANMNCNFPNFIFKQFPITSHIRNGKFPVLSSKMFNKFPIT